MLPEDWKRKPKKFKSWRRRKEKVKRNCNSLKLFLIVDVETTKEDQIKDWLKLYNNATCKKIPKTIDDFLILEEKIEILQCVMGWFIKEAKKAN